MRSQGELKVCSKCRQVKTADEFYNMYKRADGKDPYCKDCRRECNLNYQRAIVRPLPADKKLLRKQQNMEYNMRKYGVPYEPAWHRKARASATRSQLLEQSCVE